MHHERIFTPGAGRGSDVLGLFEGHLRGRIHRWPCEFRVYLRRGRKRRECATTSSVWRCTALDGGVRPAEEDS